MAKTICWCQYTQKKEAEKNGDKNGKELYKLMNNAAYGKIMENLRNRIDAKLVSNKKNCLKMDIPTKLYFTQIIWKWFSNDTYKQSYIKS